MKKVNIEEVQKPFWKSKSVWAAILVVLLTILIALGIVIPNEVYIILGAFGFVGIRDAVSKINWK